jgi:hypothetical protein
LDWKISENGAFSISGSGAMPNYTGSSNVPWDKYRASIKSVTIGSDVTSIGNNAFKDCTGITGITIGSGVKSIGNFAFNGCSGLTSVTIHATTPPALADGQFYGGSKMTLYVPKSNTMVSGVPQYVDAYQKVPAWGRSFGNIAEQK